MLTVEGRPRVRGDIDRPLRGAGCRVKGIQLVSGGVPNVLTVIGDAPNVDGTFERPVFANNLSGRCMHMFDPSPLAAEWGATMSS